MEDKVREIILKYDSDKAFLVPILQDVQKEYNYLPKKALTRVGVFLDLPLSQIYEVATFYKAFSLTPRGEHQLSLCMGTACHVRGAAVLENHLERALEIKPGETTSDLKFSFDTVNCVGACALGPILEVDGEYQGKMSISKGNKLLKKLGKKVDIDEED
jgi:NADH-quinone oxidoreductase subunit E